MTDPHDAQNDTTDEDETTPHEDGELANPGPVPAAAEDSADSGQGPSGSLAPQARTDRDE